jgi:hypothetical protein
MRSGPSGLPVLNRSGALCAIVRQGGAGARFLKDALKKYRPKPKRGNAGATIAGLVAGLRHDRA